MKKLATFGVVLMLLTLTAVGVAAETELEVSGQVRLRGETDGKSLDTSKTITNVRMIRTRINLDATVDGNAHAFVQFQDSRILGGKDQLGEWQSGGLNHGSNVDIHQAYVQIDRLWLDGLGTRAGRFELNLGNQRVFGAVGWSNVGRTWEGSMSWYKGKGYKVSGFWFKAQEEMEKSNVLANRDFDIIGLHAKFDKANLELFGIYELDQDTLYVDSTSTVKKGDRLKRLTFGMYYKRKHNQMDFEFNAALQTGTMVDTVDISGLMFTGEVGYSLEGDKKARVAAAIDYTSGDDNQGDNDHKAYNNLYYTGHKFRGHMDYFVGSANHGLIDIILRGKFNIAPKWTVKGDFHYFKTAADYSLPTATVGDSVVTTTSTDAGMEFDFSVSTASVADVKLVGGLSIFLPQESFVTSQLVGMAPSDENLSEPVSVQKAKWAMDRSHTDPRVWAYCQTIINF